MQNIVCIKIFSHITDKLKEQRFFAQLLYKLSGTQPMYQPVSLCESLILSYIHPNG